MRKILLLSFMSIATLHGAPTKSYECTQIFESRKNELLIELGKIDEQRQSLDALKRATEDLLKKKEAMVQGRGTAVDQKLQEIKTREASIQKILADNKKILEEMKQLKSNKVSQAYTKMKPASSANILAQMGVKEASDILSTLNPKIVSQILGKMDPKKGAEITAALQKIPSELSNKK
ncbi:MAG: PDP protein [Campylobacterales bacterium]|nr:PDP protein [Campylobacterales bacterium]